MLGYPVNSGPPPSGMVSRENPAVAPAETKKNRNRAKADSSPIEAAERGRARHLILGSDVSSYITIDVGDE